MAAPDEARARSHFDFRWLILVVTTLVAGWFLFARGMQRDLNHDEHQFIAPGILLSREGLLPYRDYPLFHLPNLVFAYAVAERLIGWPIFSTKLLSILASTLLVGSLAFVVLRERAQPLGVRMAAVLSLCFLLLYDPVFLFTAGKTWNHEVPTFLIVGSILLQALTFRKPSFFLIGVAGLLGGLSAGSRLTFGPMLIPLFGMAWLIPGSRSDCIRHGLAWSAGAFLGLSPSLWFFLTDREAFLFGNFEFPRLRVSDETNLRVQKTIRLSAKFRYLFKEIIRGSWPLFVAFGLLAIRPGWQWLRGRGGVPLCGFALLALPFAILGCFAPTRYQYQHFFGVIGLVALGVAGGMSAYLHLNKGRRVYIYAAVFAMCAVLAGTYSDRVKNLYRMGNPPFAEWYAWDIHTQAEELRRHVPEGKILTLAPTLVLEAGLEIYPEFATGPFAMKSAPLVAKKRRSALGLVAPEDLAKGALKEKPAGILTGIEEKELERPLLTYATAHSYRPIQLKRRRVLWVPPVSETSGN